MKKMFFGAALGVCLAAGLAGAAIAQGTNKQKPKPSQVRDILFDIAPEIGVESLIFYRNIMYFTDGREAYGASSSLINVDGRVHVVTAKHLLTDSMGIVPSVPPSRFEEETEGWYVTDNLGYHNMDNASVIVPVAGILEPNDDWNEDFIVLETEALTSEFETEVLPVSFELPRRGDRVYVFGCTYDAATGCIQAMYPAEVAGMRFGYLSFRYDMPPSNGSGFSGAPVLNDEGELVAVLTGGYGDLDIAVPLPDWLAPYTN